MRRLIAIFMGLILTLSITSCGTAEKTDLPEKDADIDITEKAENDESDAEESEEEETMSAEVTDESVSIELISCNFTTAIRGGDSEFSATTIPEKDGKVYVDAVFSVNENSIAITEEDFEVKLNYNGDDYNFNFCYESADGLGIVTYKDFPPQTKGKIHLFTLLPEDALSQTDLQLTIEAFGTSYTETVQELDNSDPLSKKTELKDGIEYTTKDGLVLKVVKKDSGKYITATGEEGRQYSGSSDFVDLILDVTNNTSENLTSLYTYSFNSEGVIKGTVQAEYNNNTELEYLSSSGIAPGETRRLHVYFKAEDTDSIIRITIGSEYFYCRMA